MRYHTHEHSLALSTHPRIQTARLGRGTIILALFGLGLGLIPLNAQEPGTPTEPAAAAEEGATAAQPALSQEQRNQILRRIEQLVTTRQQMRTSNFSDAVQRIRELSQSRTDAVNYYERATRELQFTGQSDSMSDQYRDWIDENRDKHRDNEFREALIFHLRYLTLALEYLGTPATERGRMVEPLVRYVRDLGPVLDELLAGPGGREFLRDNLDSSVFVRQMQLQNELDQLQSWENRPSNLSGIEEKTILPLLREHAPERVMSFWEFKLNRERAAASEAQLAVDAADFKNLRLPTLLWQRAEDMRDLGNVAGAYSEMLRIMDNYPNHPSFLNWARTLESYVSVPATVEGAN
jgi:hypothetical protein